MYRKGFLPWTSPTVGITLVPTTVRLVVPMEVVGVAPNFEVRPILLGRRGRPRDYTSESGEK